MATPPESLRARLEALNRGPLPEKARIAAERAQQKVTASLEAKTASDAAGGGQGPAAVGNPSRPGVVPPIAGLLARGHAVTNDAGEHWRICLPVESLWPGGEALVGKRMEFLREQRLHASAAEKIAASSELCAITDAFPDGVTLLDLETCGLSGSAVFLAGVLCKLDDALVVELLLARNYAEEAAMLTTLWQRMESARVLVTFNGKSFDWPMVVDRWQRHLLARGKEIPAPQHVDLLHASRRRWRRELPDCKLQTLEQRICGRGRKDDVPGHRIPAVYQEYVRTGFDRELCGVLQHNALDLVTLLDLAGRLAQ